MNKQQFLEYLIPELERLEEIEHVSKLSEEGRYLEIEDIIRRIDYSKACEYWKEYYKIRPEKILNSDIPSEYKFAWGVYMNGSFPNQVYWMGYDEANKWEEELNAHGKAGKIMANALKKISIIRYSFFYFMMEGERYEKISKK